MFPNREAVILDDQHLTYAELERLTAQAAHVLRELGIGRRDRVGIVIPNVPAFVVWYYACLRLGAIAVSISTRLTGAEVAFMLSDGKAKVVIGTNSLVESMSGEVPDCTEHVLRVSDDALSIGDEPLGSSDSIGEGCYEEMEPDDPATILYTSGTTGFPKGATLSHRNVRATVHAFNHLCGMQTEDLLLLSVPLFHCYGQNALLNSGLNVGATIVLQRRFDLGESKRLIRDHGVTMLFGVPTTFQLMLESCEPAELSSIRYCFSAAAKLPEQLSRGWYEKFQMPIFEGYGLTETAPFASYNHRLQFVPGSIGMPVDLVEMKIVDPETGEKCPPGTPGEIAIRGPNVMLGYWNRPEETADAIRDGWFYSGDIGEVDERGYFYILDRLKDMIVVGGLKVFPAEVERVLLDHGAVGEAAVVGRSDEVLGEKVVAFIIRAPEAKTTEDEIRSYCQLHLGSYKVPRQVVFVDELPRNPAGKVLKMKLRDVPLPVSEPTALTAGTSTITSMPARPAASGVGSEASGPLIERLLATHPASRERFLGAFLQEVLKDLTQCEEAPAVDGLIIDDEIDSLLIVEFRDRLQTQVGARLQLPATIVFDHPKISDLATHLLASLELERATEPAIEPAPRVVAASTVSGRDPEQPIENMSEQQAMEALLREVND